MRHNRIPYQAQALVNTRAFVSNGLMKSCQYFLIQVGIFLNKNRTDSWTWHMENTLHNYSHWRDCRTGQDYCFHLSMGSRVGESMDPFPLQNIPLTFKSKVDEKIASLWLVRSRITLTNPLPYLCLQGVNCRFHSVNIYSINNLFECRNLTSTVSFKSSCTMLFLFFEIITVLTSSTEKKNVDRSLLKPQKKLRNSKLALRLWSLKRTDFGIFDAFLKKILLFDLFIKILQLQDPLLQLCCTHVCSCSVMSVSAYCSGVL